MQQVLRAYADPEGEEAAEIDTAQRFEKALFGAYYAVCEKQGCRFLRAWSAFDRVIAAVNDEANLVEKEHKIDLIRWNESLELATFDYFDIAAILSYLVRINIVARWMRLDAARGREMFDRLVAGLDGRKFIEQE